MKVLILCGGLGTRIRPVVKGKPKCMIKVAGKPVLEHIVNHLKNHGLTEIVVNLHYHPEKVMSYFGSRLLYFYEPKPLGRDKTIAKLRDWLGEKFMVINGDTLSDVDLTAMKDLGWSCRYMDKDTFAGYEIVDGEKKAWEIWFPQGYWIDMGTPQGLAKARRLLK